LILILFLILIWKGTPLAAAEKLKHLNEGKKCHPERSGDFTK
jgi:hypothetical protein